MLFNLFASAAQYPLTGGDIGENVQLLAQDQAMKQLKVRDVQPQEIELRLTIGHRGSWARRRRQQKARIRAPKKPVKNNGQIQIGLTAIDFV